MRSATGWDAVSVLNVANTSNVTIQTMLQRKCSTQVTQSLSKHVELTPSVPVKARGLLPPIWANQCIVCSAEDKFEDIFIL